MYTKISGLLAEISGCQLSTNMQTRHILFMTTAASPIAKLMNVRPKLRVSSVEFMGYAKVSQNSAEVMLMN